MFIIKMWTAGLPWVQVKARVKKGYPSVQYATWMVILYYNFSIKQILLFIFDEKQNLLGRTTLLFLTLRSPMN